MPLWTGRQTKHQIMRTLNISLLTIATIGLALSSLAITTHHKSDNILYKNREIKSSRYVTPPATKAECLILPKEIEEKKHHVRIKILNSDGMISPDYYSVNNCAAIGEWGAVIFEEDHENPTYWYADLPEGHSDLLLNMFKVENYDLKHLIYLVKKDLTIDKDIEIIIDAEEATLLHSFKSVKNNGQELTTPLYRMTENPDNPYVMNMELLEEGTVDDCTIQTIFCSEKYGPMFKYICTSNCRIEGYQSPFEVANCYTNEAEGYYVIQNRAYQSENETNEIVTLIPDNPDQLNVSNDIDDFFNIEIPLIEQTLAGKETEHQLAEGSFPQFEMIYYGKKIGSRDFFVPGLLNPGKEQRNCRNIKLSLPSRKDLQKNLKMEFSPQAMDMMVRFQQDTIWWDECEYEIIDQSKTALDFGRVINVIPDREIYMNGQILKSFLSTRLSSTYPLPYHPYFPDYSQMQSLDYNTTQPYVTSIFATSESGNYHLYTYLDNLGGKISTYEYAQDYKLKHDGNLILDSKDYDDLIDRSEALNQALDETRESGTYELELTTFKGDIGGVDSRTTFTAKFGGMGADETAPSLQILNFINKENEITNHFDNPSDGLIRLTGGDFELRPEGLENTDAFVKTTETITPVIEYSPYARESWEALNPELQDIEAEACYGDSWTVDLKDMNVRQTNSWYDLRITMTDATGNSISQVISPAFYIGNGTGIKSSYGEAQIHVKGNDIYGPDDMQVFGPDGRRYGTKGLTAGFYVVRSGKTSKKVIIR